MDTGPKIVCLVIGIILQPPHLLRHPEISYICSQRRGIQRNYSRVLKMNIHDAMMVAFRGSLVIAGKVAA
jgi:hypothetical protein